MDTRTMRTEKTTLSLALRKYGHKALSEMTEGSDSHFTHLLFRAKTQPLSSRHVRCIIMKQGRGKNETLVGWAVIDGSKATLRCKDRYASMGVCVKRPFRGNGYGKKLLALLLESEEKRKTAKIPTILASPTKIVRGALLDRGRVVHRTYNIPYPECIYWVFYSYR